MTYRLISKERDYYDYAFYAYGFDPKKIFKRNTSTISLARKESNNLFRGKDVYTPFTTNFIGVCGRWYRCVQHKNGWVLTGYNHNKTPFDDVFEHLAYSSGQSGFFIRNNRSYRYKKALKDYSKKIDVVSHDLFVKYDTAVLFLDRDNLTLYPKLSDFGFSCVMSPEEIHQEIEMYLESTLAKYEEIGCIPNENKILSAGFDLKQSFRHRNPKARK